MIKVGGIYCLLRNLSLDCQLVKNVHIVVIDIGSHLITVHLIGPNNMSSNEDILIPCIPFTYILSSGHTLQCKQFPLAPAYATTFNSCQGLTLDKIGVDLVQPVFSHGQLYKVLSRIKHRSHTKIHL